MNINSPEEMFELGKKIGSKLVAGDVILLRGELGAGKTALTRGIGSALGIKDVSSPTFLISKIYQGGPLPLIHVDAYRLMGGELAGFDDLDLESRIPTSITVVEWGDGFVQRVVDKFITVAISFGQSDSERIVEIEGIDL
jgi:tRNA threonylcarbamoyladenosine biosynthesis protein TsaE